MELNHQEVDTPPRAAASVVLLRDGTAGLEVFLLRRHDASSVLGGLYVFPGGKLDGADSAPAALEHIDMPLAALHQALGESDLDPATAASLFVAACRETFEEAGVLFARGAGAAQAREAAALLKEGVSFSEALKRMNLVISASRVTPWARWVTPRTPSLMNKRFDVRFFVALVPRDQVAAHDNYEATESVWLSPRAALKQYWDGQISLAPPQIMSLSELAHHSTAAEVLDPARRVWPRTVHPAGFEEDGQRVVAYPGDPRHELKEPVMPGPSRLVFRNKRFEPPGGFEELFA